MSRDAPGRGLGTQGAAEPINLVVFIGFTIAMTGGVFFAASQLSDHDVSATPAAVGGVTNPGMYEVELVAGNPVPLKNAFVYIEVDGDRMVTPLSDWVDDSSESNYWRAGQRICIVGNYSHCAALTGKEVRLTLVIGNNIAVEHRGIVPPERVPPTTMVVPNATAPNATAPNATAPNSTQAADPPTATTPDGIYFHCARDPRVTILGTNITYGRGGPDVDVRLELNDSSGYRWLFDGLPIESGWNHTPHMEAGSTLSLRGTASHHQWSATYAPPDPHVVFLRHGDTPPNPEPFDGQEPLSTFLAPYVDTQNQTMVLEPEEIIVLMEFANSLRSSAADFQDAVVLIDVGKDPC